MRRELGRYRGGEGPTVVLIGGLHGNEPSGVAAIERVFAELAQTKPELAGMVLGLAGNLPAIERDVRYIDRDLNRRWTTDSLASLRAQDRAADGIEDAEQLELLGIFETLTESRRDLSSRSGSRPELASRSGSRPDLIALDLHSFSAEGPAFSVIAHHPQNRPIAFELRVPIIFGLAEAVTGTLLDYLAELGHTAVGFEAGQHRDPDTVELHVAAIWVTLVVAGLLKADDVVDFDQHQARLDRARGDLPRAVEIVHRHPVVQDDGFVMDPGWCNFQPVGRGQRVASDREGPLQSPHAGFMLMPLYQALGHDGFFVAREL